MMKYLETRIAVHQAKLAMHKSSNKPTSVVDERTIEGEQDIARLRARLARVQSFSTPQERADELPRIQPCPGFSR